MNLMLLPREPVCYQKAACTLRDFQEMMGEFKLEGFSGYILLSFPHVEYTLLIEKGIPVRVMNVQSVSTIEEVRLQFEETPAYVLVVELPWFSVDQMVRIVMCSRAYENLLTDFVDFQRLLGTLEKERLTGIMEVQIGSRVHFMVFSYGIPQFSVLQYNSAVKKEPVEDLVQLVEKRGAVINFYIPKEMEFVSAFEFLGTGILSKFSELNGKRLTGYMVNEMNTFLAQYEGITIKNGSYFLEKVPDDYREQESLFKEILRHQVTLLEQSIGRRATYAMYSSLLRSLHDDVREIFREVIL